MSQKKPERRAWIKLALSQACGSQARLAEEMGMTRNAPQNWVRGKGPSQDNLYALVGLLRERAFNLLRCATHLELTQYDDAPDLWPGYRSPHGPLDEWEAQQRKSRADWDAAMDDSTWDELDDSLTAALREYIPELTESLPKLLTEWREQRERERSALSAVSEETGLSIEELKRLTPGARWPSDRIDPTPTGAAPRRLPPLKPLGFDIAMTPIEDQTEDSRQQDKLATARGRLPGVSKRAWAKHRESD